METFHVDSRGPRRCCWGCGTQRNIKVCEHCKCYKFCGICYDRYHTHPKRIDHGNSKTTPKRLPAAVGHRVDVSSSQNNYVSSVSNIQHKVFVNSQAGHRVHVSNINQHKHVVVNSETWICSYCTLENSKEVHICEVCGKTNSDYLVNWRTDKEKSSAVSLPLSDVVAEPQMDMKSTWTCVHCTFINEMSSQICAVCSKTNEIYLQKQNKMVNTLLDEKSQNSIKRKYDLGEDNHMKRERKFEAEPKTLDRSEVKNANQQQPMTSHFNRDLLSFSSSSIRSSGTEKNGQTFYRGNVNYDETDCKPSANSCKSNKDSNNVLEKSATNKIDKNHEERNNLLSEIGQVEISPLELAGFVSKINIKDIEDVGTSQNTANVEVEISLKNAHVHIHSKDDSTVRIDISHHQKRHFPQVKSSNEVELLFNCDPQSHRTTSNGPKQVETPEQTSSSSTKKESRKRNSKCFSNL